MELKSLIDAGIEEPPPVRVGEYVESGRRALRHRRLNIAASSVAVLAVVAGGAGAVSSLRVDAGQAPAATGSLGAEPTSPTPTPTSAPTTPASRVGPPPAASYDPETGELTIGTGWSVVERIDDPVTVSPIGEPAAPDDSVALSVIRGERMQWLVLWHRGAGSGTAAASWETSRGGFASFEEWVDYRVAVQTGGSTDQLVSMAVDGSLSPLHGLPLDEQRLAPELSRDGSTVTVARLWVFGAAAYVLAIRTAGNTSYFPVGYPYVGEPDTLDGFVQHVAPDIAAGRYP